MRNSRGKLHVRSGHMLIAILTLTIWSMPAASQQPLVLIHGLNSDASTWNVASQRLLQDENVTITTPTLSSLTTYENQASSLLAQINGVPGNAIAIGHSNGGIVARQAAADGRSWSGIITIAGPHGGAPLAANVMNYLLFEDAENMAANVTAPFAFYSQFYPDDWGWELGEYAGYFLWTVAAAMPGIAAAEGYALENTVVPEMEPGYLVQTVNSQANLNREAAVIPQRIAITSTVATPFGLLFHGLIGESYLSDGRAVYTAGDILYAAGDYYTFYDDYEDPWFQEKQENAYLWYVAGDEAYHFDQNWCGLIGAQDAYGNCYQSDGLLPVAVQQYPGATYTAAITGPGHVEETSSDAVITAVENELTAHLNVQPNGGGGGSVTANVSGPTSVSGCTTGNWTAAASGGTPPYTYQWTAEGGNYNTGSQNQLEYTNQGNLSFFVHVTATDSHSVSGSSSSYKVNVRLPGAC